MAFAVAAGIAGPLIANDAKDPCSDHKDESWYVKLEVNDEGKKGEYKQATWAKDATLGDCTLTGKMTARFYKNYLATDPDGKEIPNTRMVSWELNLHTNKKTTLKLILRLFDSNNRPAGGLFDVAGDYDADGNKTDYKWVEEHAQYGTESYPLLSACCRPFSCI